MVVLGRFLSSGGPSAMNKPRQMTALLIVHLSIFR